MSTDPQFYKILPILRSLTSSLSDPPPPTLGKLLSSLASAISTYYSALPIPTATQIYYIVTAVFRLSKPSDDVIEPALRLLSFCVEVIPPPDLVKLYPIIPFCIAEKSNPTLQDSGFEAGNAILRVADAKNVQMSAAAPALAHMAALCVDRIANRTQDPECAKQSLESVLFLAIKDKNRLREIFPGIVLRLLKVCVENLPRKSTVSGVLHIVTRLIEVTFLAPQDQWTSISGLKLLPFFQRLATQDLDSFGPFCDELLRSCYNKLSVDTLDLLVAHCSILPEKSASEPWNDVLRARLDHYVARAKDDVVRALYLADHVRVARKITRLSEVVSGLGQSSAYAVATVIHAAILECASMYGTARAKSGRKDGFLTVLSADGSGGDIRLFEGVLEKGVEKAIVGLSRAIGENSEIAVDVCGALLSELSASEKATILWFCNGILAGNLGKKSIEMAENAYLMLEMTTELSGELGECVKADTIALVCTYMGEDFQSEIGDHVFSLVVGALLGNANVVGHSQRAMTQVSNVLYEGSVERLVEENADYILDTVNLRLVSGERGISPENLRVLSAVMNLAGKNLVQELGEVMNLCFVVLDSYYGYSTISSSFLAMFKTIVKVIGDTYGEGQEINEPRTSKPWGMESIAEVLELIGSGQKLGIEYTQEDIDSDDEVEGVIGNPPESPEDEENVTEEIDTAGDDQEDYFLYTSPVPKNLYRVVQKIISYCIRLMTTSILAKLQALETISRAIPVLATQPVELNPVLFELWPLVEKACINEDMRICSLGIRAADTMIRYGGLFLAQSFLNLARSLPKSGFFERYTSKLKNYRRLTDQALIQSNGLKSVFPERYEYEYAIAVNDLLKRGLPISRDMMKISEVRELGDYVYDDEVYY